MKPAHISNMHPARVVDICRNTCMHVELLAPGGGGGHAGTFYTTHRPAHRGTRHMRSQQHRQGGVRHTDSDFLILRTVCVAAAKSRVPHSTMDDGAFM